MTDEQMRDLVKECGLDWQRGYMPLFDGDPTNRYAVLLEAAEAGFAERLADACVAAEIPDSKFESLLIALRAERGVQRRARWTFE